jgi:hypothetical protein
VISARRRWLAGAALVGLGWLVTPQPVPVYDGLGAPDEPYRYVVPPQGAKATADATTAVAKTPVNNGTGTNGLSVATAEQGPQFSLFLPPMAMAAPGGPIEVRAEPLAPTDQPRGARIDGNVYAVTLTSASGPVTLTAKSAISTLYLRATTAAQPPPVMQYRAEASQPWKALGTSRGGQDVYVASFPGPGQYALAFAARKGPAGVPVLPIVGLGAAVLLVVVVVVVRLRSTSG